MDDTPDPCYSNSMLDEEQPKSPKNALSLFGFTFGQSEISSDDETPDYPENGNLYYEETPILPKNRSLCGDQIGYETVMKTQTSEDPEDPPVIETQTSDVGPSGNCCSPVFSYNEPAEHDTYRPYSDEQNGFETVMKKQESLPINDSNADDSPRDAPESNDDFDDGQNGYELVLKGTRGVEIENSLTAESLGMKRSPTATGDRLDSHSSNIEEPYEENETHMRITKVIEDPNDENSKSRAKIAAGVCIFCLLIVVCIILGIYLSGANEKGDIAAAEEEPNKTPEEQQPIVSSTSAPTTTTLQLPDETWDAIEQNPSGPQAKAFDWFWKDHGNHADYTSQRMLQRFVMATVYYATGGDDWTENDGWLSSDHECNWFSSVTTQPQYYEQSVTPCHSNSDTLTSLVLINNNLTGDSLPEELYLLSDMRQIDLQTNSIRGPLSPAIANMTRLARLRLGRNEMTGTIPEEVGSLSMLQVLSLYTNNFSGAIPTSLAKAQELIQIWLSSNRFTGAIPSEIGQLSELQVLWVDQNDLEGGIPRELGLLPKLQDVMLHENRLSGTLPTEIGLLGDYLSNLDLRSNRLTGVVPSELGMMTRLESMVLHENLFTGQLPSEIGLMAQISNMYISSNDLTGTIPTTIGECSNLSILWLNSNHALTGTIPSEVGKLNKIKDLFLSRNSLSGSLPSEIGLMVGLRTLALEQNVALTGTLPTELAQVRGLNKITITGTSITGTIPEDICEVHEDALRFDCTANLCGCGVCPC